MRFKAAASTAALAMLVLHVPQWATHATTAPVEQPRLAAPRSVTLITGDRVVFSSADRLTYRIEPAKGRERISFKAGYEILLADGKPHLFVTPIDAMPLIGAGKLDRALFDVTALLDSAYDDSSRKSLPLIVTYADTAAMSATALTGTSVTRHLRSVNGAAVEAPKQQIANLWNTVTGGAAGARAALSTQGAIRKIWLDRLSKPALDRSVPQIGAPVAWGSGYTGAGVIVGVVDTGVDQTHPDLAGKVIATENFVAPMDPTLGDNIGHGTHVASTIAGTGAGSGGRYRGVAPDAQVVSAKVCFSVGCPDSAVIAGMEWAVLEAGATIVNMSLGGPDSEGIDPMEEAVNRLTAEHGVLFVVAAGNSGPRSSTVSSPATAEAALGVAAVDKRDRIASFSSRGPRRPDFGIKPEVSAPGVDIVAALAAGANIGTPIDGIYTSLNGTSMATPHVAGAAALLKQRHPQWDAQEIKAALIGSAKFSPATNIFDEGAGRIDVAAAFASAIQATPSTLNLGVAAWPHHDDPTLEGVVAFRNTGTTTASVSLSAELQGPDGTAPVAGMFTLSPTVLSIPAGAAAEVKLSINTRLGTVDGTFTGRLIARFDGQTTSVPLTLHREEESYDFTISHFDRSGAPARTYDTTFVRLDKQPQTVPTLLGQDSEPGERRLRLPAGRYLVSVSIMPESPTEGPATIVKTMQVRADGRITFDARLTSPVTVRSPSTTASAVVTQHGFEYPLSWSKAVPMRLEIISPFSPEVFYFDQRARVPGLKSWIGKQWQDPGSTDAARQPAHYGATWVEHGRLPTGPTKIMPLHKAAMVHENFPPAPPGVARAAVGIGTVVDFGYDPPVYVASVPIGLPNVRTQYLYSNDPAVFWLSQHALFGATPGTTLAQFGKEAQSYRAARRYEVRWNEPPYGPAFDTTAQPLRIGDDLLLPAPLHGDRQGHPGFVAGDTRYTLYRDGAKVAELSGGSALTTSVPPERASYRLEASEIQTLFRFSTRVSAQWTFESEHADASSPVPLPIITVRAQPELDAQGRAYRGARFELPISVEQVRSQEEHQRCSHLDELEEDAGSEQERDRAGADERCHPPIRPTIEVSYDDGAHWKAMPVKRRGRQWVAELFHPSSAEFVSLRSSARDYAGNSVEQTVIRAYGLMGEPKKPKR